MRSDACAPYAAGSFFSSIGIRGASRVNGAASAVG